MSKPKAAEPIPAGDPVTRFETSMQELEGIVQKLERGELKLEESLVLFERGMVLTQDCRTALDTAELKVKTLVDGQFKDE
ncbi:MAG: exodeoxyribonuclease VII small subunit [Stagnimonas sp.]|nr:exodeoxyribonuclease VII small subunit [Stagnimonas sp.]